jgi:sRNA-binding regulator protein Hfq
MRNLKLTFLLLITVFVSCKDDTKTIAELENMHAIIKKEFAPDKRVELFDVRFKNTNNTIVLTGETTSKKAFNILLDSLKRKNITYKNEVRILPDSAVGNKTYALGNNSVINIRSKPKHSAELGTQGLLGMELKVLDKKGSWYRIQTPDKYISWVDTGGIERMTAEELQTWNKKDKIIYTTNSGFVYELKNDNSTRVSDIAFGGILAINKEYDSFYEAEYPDGRIGFVKKSEAVLYNAWLKNNPSNATFIEESAKTMLGVPYLWGGTSPKGNDCSGFTKTVYLMNGFVIPRDASQQIHAGKVVDENLKFEGLEKGDLMFFGTPAKDGKKMRVTHVGIWLGNDKGEFIHSASNVHLSSINENEKHYDGFNKNRYLGSRRYLGVKDDKIIDLKKGLEIKP